METIARFSEWYDDVNCQGMWRNSICVFSVADLVYLIKRNELIANKFMLYYDPIAYQCMEEWYYEREGRDLTIDEVRFYCNWIQRHSSRVKCLE